MFDGCTDLESMPVIIADNTLTGIATGKYQYAFRNCTKLKHVTTLPDLKPQSSLYQ